MEMLIPIVILLFILGFAVRSLLGKGIFEHVVGKFVYDIIIGLIKLPIRIGAGILKMMKI
jgi:hypothetical protein